MIKESFSKRLFCNLLGVGSAFSLIIIILQLRFGILSPGTLGNNTLPTAITFKPPVRSFVRSPARPSARPSIESNTPFHSKKLSRSESGNIRPSVKVILKEKPWSGFFRKIFYVLKDSAAIYNSTVFANGQVCQPIPKPFQEVFAFMYFKLKSSTGDLIRLKFLGLRVFIDNWQLCLGDGPYYCSPQELYKRHLNALSIGVRDNPDGRTRSVFFRLNYKSFKVPSPLPLTQSSTPRTIILGSSRSLIFLRELSVVFRKGVTSYLVKDDMRCSPKLPPASIKARSVK